MYSFSISVDRHIVSFNKILQNFIIGSDHPAGIDEVEIWYGVVYLQNLRFEFSRCQDGYILQLVDWSFEGDDFEFIALHLLFIIISSWNIL